MLSKDEVIKIKQGMDSIKAQRPDATLDQIVRMFNYVFGHTLSIDDRTEAENFIMHEFTKNLN